VQSEHVQTVAGEECATWSSDILFRYCSDELRRGWPSFNYPQGGAKNRSSRREAVSFYRSPTLSSLENK